MAKIDRVIGCEILDSRGDPTVAAIVSCADGVTGMAMVPSGASTGRHETIELRDNKDNRFNGKGVLQAVANVNGEIQAAMLGLNTANQNKIDRTLLAVDGTPNKSRLGGNAILAVSLACARAEAASQNLPLYSYLRQIYPSRPSVLPVPQMNLINGGRHASNGLSIQEYHVLPIGSASFSEALRMGVEIYHALKELLKSAGFQVEIADEGGFAPKLESSETAFTFLVNAIERAGYVPGVDAVLGIDAAANEFYDPEKDQYTLDGAILSYVDLSYQYKRWRERYPLLSLEDPFAEDAWEQWQKHTHQEGTYLQIIGDDLYASNPTRIREGIIQGATNAVLIKPNQIGTLTETMQAILLAQEAKQNVVISHRSGETEDTFIADLSVAVGAGQIKTGAPAGIRTAKYNRLLAIESEIHSGLSHDLQPFLEYIKPKYRVTSQ